MWLPLYFCASPCHLCNYCGSFYSNSAQAEVFIIAMALYFRISEGTLAGIQHVQESLRHRLRATDAKTDKGKRLVFVCGFWGVI